MVVRCCGWDRAFTSFSFSSVGTGSVADAAAEVELALSSTVLTPSDGDAAPAEALCSAEALVARCAESSFIRCRAVACRAASRAHSSSALPLGTARARYPKLVPPDPDTGLPSELHTAIFAGGPGANAPFLACSASFPASPARRAQTFTLQSEAL